MGGAGSRPGTMDVATQTTLSWIHELNNSSSLTVESQISESSQDEKETPSLDKLAAELLSSDSSDSSSSSSSGAISQDGEKEEKRNIPSHNLPWPAILQYIRESESESDRYFGLQGTHKKTANKKSQSTNKTKALLPATGQSTDGQTEKCQFCGEVLTPLSLLPESLEKEPEFCCSDLKEYIVLVALYTKRMQDLKLHSRPGRINLDSRRTEEKKTAQERALERMRRKQKWEDTNRKLILLQNSSVMAMSHQTKTIKFSLSSPHCMNTGWITNSFESDSRQTNTKKMSRRLPLPVLPPLSPINSSEREEEEERQEGKEESRKEDDRETKEKEGRFLEMTRYNGTTDDTHLLSIILPDNTGQTYYSSGNLAILQARLSSSVFSYILFNDSLKSQVVGYVDDLGRAWLKGDTYPIRFVSTLKDGFLMEGSGRTKLWSWNNHSSYSLYLPLIFRINQHLSLRFNNHDDITITLLSQQKQQKHQIKRIITKVSKRSTAMEKEIQPYKIDLEKMKHRFELHLKSFHQSVKILNGQQRHKPLPFIREQTQRKTKTVGSVSFQ